MDIGSGIGGFYMSFVIKISSHIELVSFIDCNIQEGGFLPGLFICNLDHLVGIITFLHQLIQHFLIHSRS